MSNFNSLSILLVLSFLFLFFNVLDGASPHHKLYQRSNTVSNLSKKLEKSSEFIKMRYHNGPIFTTNITIHLIWYGKWSLIQKTILRDFLSSFSSGNQQKAPSVFEWWTNVMVYTDKTGAHISAHMQIGDEVGDDYSFGKNLKMSDIQLIIKRAREFHPVPREFHLVPQLHRGNPLYLVLTSEDVHVEGFCEIICGLHDFTSTLRYAWVGNSGSKCPSECAFPFAVPTYRPNFNPLKSPNGDVGVDGMISVIGHELAELATNPLITGWYAGFRTYRQEIGDLCEGIYGRGGDNSYVGDVLRDATGRSYNMRGGNRKFLVQWVWNRLLNDCHGPNDSS